MSETQTAQPGNLGNKIIGKNNLQNNQTTQPNKINSPNQTNKLNQSNKTNQPNNIESILKNNNATNNNATNNNAENNNAANNNAANNNAETKNVSLTGKDADAMITQQNKINANKANANKANADKANANKTNANANKTKKNNNKQQNQNLTMKALETNQEEKPNTANTNNNETNETNENNQNNTNENNNATENTDLEPTANKAPSADKNQMINLNKLTMNLLNHQIVLKLFHFQTELYGAHKASDAYLEKFAQTMDKFLEIAQGIYGKITLKKYTLTGSSHSDENIIKHIDGMITLLREKIDDVLGEYTDLINIRDELVGDAEQLKYLLSFK